MPRHPVRSGAALVPAIGRPDGLIARAARAQLDGNPDEAIRLYQMALTIDPTNVDAINQLGVALGKNSNVLAAARQFENSLRINPDQPQIWFNHAIALAKLGLGSEALNSSDRVIELAPAYGAAQLQRAALLAGLGRYEAALSACDETVRLLPNDPLSAIQRGTVLQWCGRHDEAFGEFDRAIALNPNQAEAWVEKAMLMLLLGDLPNGFALYEWRWRTMAWDESPRRIARVYTRPVWLGETDIAGKTLLVYAEQGYGDAIHFCRYATLAASAGARVIVETNPPLKDLMTTLDGVSGVISDKEPQPDHDLRCPMMSLPLVFGTTLETIPAQTPYLRSEPSRSSAWRERLSALRGYRIGLVWASATAIGDAKLAATANRKSLPLKALAPLATVTGCSYVSLQIGPGAAEAASPPPGMLLHDHTADLHDFADTAALIDNLDLVISVCTATAHLAGALAKPVWLLNRFDTAWQWMLDREDTPWYPTMRIFRQPAPGAWSSVVAAATAALRLFAAA